MIELGEVVEKIFCFKNFLTAGCRLSSFKRQRITQVLQMKTSNLKLPVAWLNADGGVMSFSSAPETVSVFPWNLKNNASLCILHDIFVRHCNLSGYIKNKISNVFPFPSLIEAGHRRVEKIFFKNSHFKLHQGNKRTVIVENGKDTGISLYQKVTSNIQGR
jgi:hypothetical protein